MNRRRAVVIVGTLAAAQTAMHTIAAFFIAYIQLRLLRGLRIVSVTESGLGRRATRSRTAQTLMMSDLI